MLTPLSVFSSLYRHAPLIWALTKRDVVGRYRGSVLGVLWFALLLASGSAAVLVLGGLGAVGMSVWLCGAGERLLEKKDPGSVVLDEIAAVPICFIAWLAIFAAKTGALAGMEDVFSQANWIRVAAVFAAFRLFDALKLWPVRQRQGLPGGWGITIDDLLAAGYVNLLFLAVDAVTPVQHTEVAEIPAHFALHQNYPNPFNPDTRITYDLPSESPCES